MPKSWAEIGIPLHEDVRKGIKSFNFPTMTPIQASTIPQLINKKDVVAEAVTGSGKTLAFLIPLLEILKRREAEEAWKKYEIGALIISPTRELALQTKEVLDQLVKFTSGLNQLVFVGGTSVEEDLSSFKCNGANIIICTPGRFEDLLRRKSDICLTSALKSLEILILDEADRLLDYGFQNSLNMILSYLPKQRRTGLFSATQTKQVQDLIRAGLRNPVLISVSCKAEHSTPESLNNYYIVVNNNKLITLLSFIEANNVQKAMLFLPTCAVVDYWSAVFPNILSTKLELTVFAIHGKMKEKRKKVLAKFRESSKALLLCTDVMARGIDIPEMDWVLQWDPPSNASAFIHRVGRTARQGRQGSSLILLLENEAPYVNFIENNQRIKLQKLTDTTNESMGDNLRNILHSLQMTDRDLMEKATRAFVSHIRAYSKHECSLLLKVKELPLGNVASTYGLLQLPKMPELRNTVLTDFKTISSDINLDKIPYKDKKKEESRQHKLEIYKKTGTWPGKDVKFVKKATQSWSITKEKKLKKKEKQMKRQQAKKSENNKGQRKKRKRISVDNKDLQELAKDIALIKKFKKKKVDEEQFNKEFGIL